MTPIPPNANKKKREGTSTDCLLELPTVARSFDNEVSIQCTKATSSERNPILAAVTSGLLTIVKTGITIVSYFGNVTASLFALTIVRKFTPR